MVVKIGTDKARIATMLYNYDNQPEILTSVMHDSSSTSGTVIVSFLILGELEN